jgi:hypothetical protein
MTRWKCAHVWEVYLDPRQERCSRCGSICTRSYDGAMLTYSASEKLQQGEIE